MMFDVSASDAVSCAVVHAESNLRYGRAAIVLRHRSPCVTESIDAIPVLLCNAHALANLSDAYVHVSAETVAGGVPVMEIEQPFTAWY